MSHRNQRWLGRARAPIVVGITDDDRTAVALSWAAHHAVLSDRPLRLVHAHPVRISVLLAGGLVELWDQTDAARQVQHVLDDALDLVQELAPCVPVSACADQSSPARLLLDEADMASMVVLGNHAPGWPMTC